MPSNSLSWACHMRYFATFGDRNNLLNLGIGGKYHITFAGTPFLFLVFVLSNFHHEVPQVGHEDESFKSFLYNMQSFGQACIFSNFILNAFNVFFASYIDKGNSLFRGNISPTIPKSSKNFY